MTKRISRRWLIGGAALVVVLLAVLGVTAYALRSGPDPAFTDAAKCSDATTEAGMVRRVGAPSGTTIAVIGDSYSVGTGTDTPNTQAWPAQLDLDAVVEVRGEGRTGFLNGGYCGGHTYSKRVAEVAALSPSMVIVQGGTNDVGLGDVEARATEVARSFPGVRVVLVGPVLVPARDAEKTRSVDRGLSAASRNAGAEYVSALDWDIELSSDRLHPTADGYRDFAARLTAAVS